MLAHSMGEGFGRVMEERQVVTPGPAPGETAMPTGKMLIGDLDDERSMFFWNLASRNGSNTLQLPFLLVAYKLDTEERRREKIEQRQTQALVSTTEVFRR
jgi:hypothetical protein